MIGEEKILVLRRSKKYGVNLKLRKSGRDGSLLEGESKFLSEDTPRSRELIGKLKAGEVIYL